MARATTVTKLSLDRWAEIIGLDPMHFNGIYSATHSPTVCQQPWMQYAWQAADRVGREEVAYAIAQAEVAIEGLLGYRLMPSWETDEWRPTARGPKPELVNYTFTDVRGFGPTVRANWGYFVTGGIRTKALVANAVAVVATDPDGDGFNELGTITVAVASGQDPCEIKVYFPGYSGNDQYEIRPINVSVTALVATITLNRTLLVNPTVYTDMTPPADDSHWRGVASDSASFVTTVDVYRVYNDPQTQVTMHWEPWSAPCGCGGSGCTTCAFSSQTGCLMPRDDPRHSIVAYTPADWNAVTEEFDQAGLAEARVPDLVRLYYQAGWRDKGLTCPTVTMDPQLERAVAYYASALLDRPICECNNVRTYVEHWQESALGTRVTEAASQLMANPLGISKGAQFVWNQIRVGRRLMSPITEPVLL